MADQRRSLWQDSVVVVAVYPPKVAQETASGDRHQRSSHNLQRLTPSALFLLVTPPKGYLVSSDSITNRGAGRGPVGDISDSNHDTEHESLAERYHKASRCLL